MSCPNSLKSLDEMGHFAHSNTFGGTMGVSRMPSFGIDFGTANTVAYFEGKGFYPCKKVQSLPSAEDVADATKLNLSELHPPLRSYAVARKSDDKIIAVGDAAYNMVGREPRHLKVLRCIEEGRVRDTNVMVALFDTLFAQAYPELQQLEQKGRRLQEPEMIIIPVSGNTEPMHQQLMRQTMLERFLDLGHDPYTVVIDKVYKGKVVCVSQAGVALLGSGVNIMNGGAQLVIDIGGGTTNIAIICNGEVIFHRSFPIGGDLMNLKIAEFVNDKKGLEIGLLDAESIKIKLARAIEPNGQAAVGTIDGKCTDTGLPKRIKLSALDVYQCLESVLDDIGNAVLVTLDEFGRPQILSDISKNPSWLAGGGSQVAFLDRRLQKKTGLKIERVENPMYSVIRGVNVLFENPELIPKFDLKLLSKEWKEDSWNENQKRRIQAPPQTDLTSTNLLTSETSTRPH